MPAAPVLPSFGSGASIAGMPGNASFTPGIPPGSALLAPERSACCCRYRRLPPCRRDCCILFWPPAPSPLTAVPAWLAPTPLAVPFGAPTVAPRPFLLPSWWSMPPPPLPSAFSSKKMPSRPRLTMFRMVDCLYDGWGGRTPPAPLAPPLLIEFGGCPYFPLPYCPSERSAPFPSRLEPLKYDRILAAVACPADNAGSAILFNLLAIEAPPLP